MHIMSGIKYDMKINITIAAVRYNTKMSTLSSGLLQQHYAIRANIYKLQ